MSPSEESYKASPISPNQLIQGKKPANKKDAPKRSGAEERSTSGQEAPRPDRGFHHWPWWLPRPACGVRSSPRLLRFSATLCFPTRLFFGLCCVLPLKVGCIWLGGG